MGETVIAPSMMAKSPILVSPHHRNFFQLVSESLTCPLANCSSDLIRFFTLCHSLIKVKNLANVHAACTATTGYYRNCSSSLYQSPFLIYMCHFYTMTNDRVKVQKCIHGDVSRSLHIGADVALRSFMCILFVRLIAKILSEAPLPKPVPSSYSKVIQLIINNQLFNIRPQALKSFYNA